jgi:hypothetical protein
VMDFLREHRMYVLVAGLSILVVLLLFMGV